MKHLWTTIALFIGFMATAFMVVLWIPLALGCQVAQYAEHNQAVAIFEFVMALVGCGVVGKALLDNIRRLVVQYVQTAKG